MPFKTILSYFDTESKLAENAIPIQKNPKKRQIPKKDTTDDEQDFLANFLMPKLSKKIEKKPPQFFKEEFVEDISTLGEESQTKPKQKILYVYTDGSCILNGKPNARGAWAVYFPGAEFPDMAERYRDHPTNQRCELTAIWRALETIRNYLIEGGLAELYTDSEYSIKCLTEYCRKWSQNGWLKADKKPIENRDIIEPLYSLYISVCRNVQIKHIRAHTGNQDKHSLANDTVDQMARAAITNN